MEIRIADRPNRRTITDVLTVKWCSPREKTEERSDNTRLWSLLRWTYDTVLKPFMRLIFRLAEALVGLVQPPIERYVCKKPIRFINVLSQHVGHLAFEPDTYLKEGILGRRPDYTTIMLARRDRIANPHLVTYLSQHMTVLTRPCTCLMLLPFSLMKGLRYDVGGYANTFSNSAACVIHREWGARSPLWTLTPHDRERGLENLRLLGLPAGAWYVCVHARTSGYDNSSGHAFRNADIETYFLAINAIVERGGWCLRMGDPSMPLLPPMDGVVDYCHSRLRSDLMDVFLCASCRFFLGSDSGLGEVSSIFGRPAIVANAAPLFHTIRFSPQDIGIPKLYWSDKEERFLTFKEIAQSHASSYRFSHLFNEARLTLMENSPDEIRDLTLEMMEKLDGAATYTPEDEVLQNQFRSLMKPTHYTYGAPGRVGRDFLRKYRALME